jgi:guanine deaminase
LNNHQKYLNRAIELAIEKSQNGTNGPFGAVICSGDEIVSEGWNQVVDSNDPTAHAEIVAIREACKKLKKVKLDDCVLYTSCEPCPMCLSAIYWAGISNIYYAATKYDAEKAGFLDKKIYDELCNASDDRLVKLVCIPIESAKKPFDLWQANNNRIMY